MLEKRVNFPDQLGKELNLSKKRLEVKHTTNLLKMFISY